jgi:hypothetical protein
MKKKSGGAIPDFSRKRPAAGAKPGVPATDKPHVQPNPRTPQKPPAQSKSGGRRGG